MLLHPSTAEQLQVRPADLEQAPVRLPSLTAEGATVDEATATALGQLRLDRHQVTVRVLREPKHGSSGD
ncbi:MAG: Jag N-terminal domain-containing protein [Acidimicrobiales bacterium]